MDNVKPCIPHVARKCAEIGQLVEQRRRHVSEPSSTTNAMHRPSTHYIGGHLLFERQ
jgi:hypothetical protein